MSNPKPVLCSCWNGAEHGAFTNAASKPTVAAVPPSGVRHFPRVSPASPLGSKTRSGNNPEVRLSVSRTIDSPPVDTLVSWNEFAPKVLAESMSPGATSTISAPTPPLETESATSSKLQSEDSDVVVFLLLKQPRASRWAPAPSETENVEAIQPLLGLGPGPEVPTATGPTNSDKTVGIGLGKVLAVPRKPPSIAAHVCENSSVS